MRHLEVESHGAYIRIFGFCDIYISCRGRTSAEWKVSASSLKSYPRIVCFVRFLLPESVFLRQPHPRRWCLNRWCRNWTRTNIKKPALCCGYPIVIMSRCVLKDAATSRRNLVPIEGSLCTSGSLPTHPYLSIFLLTAAQTVAEVATQWFDFRSYSWSSSININVSL